MSLNTKKLEGLLSQLDKVGAAAVKELNAMTDGAYKDSPMEREPAKFIGTIGVTLEMALIQAKANAKFDGLDAEQISALQEKEREDEKANLQQYVQEKLAKRRPQEPEPTQEESEPAKANGDPAPNDPPA